MSGPRVSRQREGAALSLFEAGLLVLLVAAVNLAVVVVLRDVRTEVAINLAFLAGYLTTRAWDVFLDRWRNR